MDPESQEAGRQASALEDRLFEALESKLALGIVPEGAHLLHLVPIPLDHLQCVGEHLAVSRLQVAQQSLVGCLMKVKVPVRQDGDDIPAGLGQDHLNRACLALRRLVTAGLAD